MKEQEIVEKLKLLNSERDKLIGLLQPYKDLKKRDLVESRVSYSIQDMLKTANDQFLTKRGVISKNGNIYVFEIINISYRQFNVYVTITGVRYNKDTLHTARINEVLFMSKALDFYKNEVIFSELDRIKFINQNEYNAQLFYNSLSYKEAETKLKLAQENIKNVIDNFVKEYVLINNYNDSNN